MMSDLTHKPRLWYGPDTQHYKPLPHDDLGDEGALSNNYRHFGQFLRFSSNLDAHSQLATALTNRNAILFVLKAAVSLPQLRTRCDVHHFVDAVSTHGFGRRCIGELVPSRRYGGKSTKSRSCRRFRRHSRLPRCRRRFLFHAQPRGTIRPCLPCLEACFDREPNSIPTTMTEHTRESTSLFRQLN